MRGRALFRGKVVPCTGRTSGNQPKMQAFDYFCWAFWAATIWACVSRHLDTKPLEKDLVLDNDKDAHVMSQGDTKGAARGRD